LIHRPDDPDIQDANGTPVWHHEKFKAFLSGEAPESVNPNLWRHALLNNYRGLFKVCDGVWQVRGESLANVTFIKTNTGYLCIDPVTTVETALYTLALLHEHVGQGPIVGMIYLHTHSHYFGGVKGMITDDDVAAVGLSPQKGLPNRF
jgi:alkyl sulfatase BDS1-like metallo-beta-lactamase superfamily hydrolase